MVAIQVELLKKSFASSLEESLKEFQKTYQIANLTGISRKAPERISEETLRGIVEGVLGRVPQGILCRIPRQYYGRILC